MFTRMMTTLQSTIIIVMVFVSISSFADSIDPGFTDSFVDEINGLRKEYAIKYHVPNMNKLVPDSQLMDMVTKFGAGFDCSPKSNYTCVRIKSRVFDNTKTAIETELNTFSGKSVDAQKLFAAEWLRLLDPYQKLIGCEFPKGLTDIFCFLGHQAQFRLFDLESDDASAAGSKCSEGYQQEDELCAPIDSEMTYFGDPDEFVDEVNSLRRKYANDYHIPDMHELTWNDELVNLAKSLSIATNPMPGAYIKWRHTRVEVYHEIAKEIEKDANEFLNKNEDERNKYLGSKDDSWVDKLEFLVPHQTQIGCAEKYEIADFYIFCVLGPVGTFTMPNLDGDSTDAPGSKCSKGYENIDGLCVYFGSPEDFVTEVNLVRRLFAKQFYIPDMHELTYDDFVQEFQFRYIKLDRYHTNKEVEGNFKEFLVKDVDERKKYLDESASRSLGGLELIAPQQTKIRCEPNFQPNDAHILCRLGPNEIMTMSNLEFDPTVIPGSKCLEGYENSDGLCTYVPTTEAPNTEAPPTEAPTKEAPTTEAPPTEASPTEAPQYQRPNLQKSPKQPQKQSSSEENSEEPEGTEGTGQEEVEDFEASTSVVINRFLSFFIALILAI